MGDVAYDVSCGVVLIEQHCAEGQVVRWHLFDGESPRRRTNGDPPASLHQLRFEVLKDRSSKSRLRIAAGWSMARFLVHSFLLQSL
jgi:hypothetical protein